MKKVIIGIIFFFSLLNNSYGYYEGFDNDTFLSSGNYTINGGYILSGGILSQQTRNSGFSLVGNNIISGDYTLEIRALTYLSYNSYTSVGTLDHKFFSDWVGWNRNNRPYDYTHINFNGSKIGNYNIMNGTYLNYKIERVGTDVFYYIDNALIYQGISDPLNDTYIHINFYNNISSIDYISLMTGPGQTCTTESINYQTEISYNFFDGDIIINNDLFNFEYNNALTGTSSISITGATISDGNYLNTGSLLDTFTPFSFESKGIFDFWDLTQPILKLENSYGINYIELIGNGNNFNIKSCDTYSNLLDGLEFGKKYFINGNYDCIELLFESSFFTDNNIYHLSYGSIEDNYQNSEVCLNDDTGDISIDGSSYSGSLDEVSTAFEIGGITNIGGYENLTISGSIIYGSGLIDNINEDPTDTTGSFFGEFNKYFISIIELFNFGLDSDYTFFITLPYYEVGGLTTKKVETDIKKIDFDGLTEENLDGIKTVKLNGIQVYKIEESDFSKFLDYFIPTVFAVLYFFLYLSFIALVLSPIWILRNVIMDIVDFLYPDKIVNHVRANGNVVSFGFYLVFVTLFSTLAIYIVGNMILYISPVLQSLKNFIGHMLNYFLLNFGFDGISIFQIVNVINVGLMAIVIAYITYIVSLKFGRVN